MWQNNLAALILSSFPVSDSEADTMRCLQAPRLLAEARISARGDFLVACTGGKPVLPPSWWRRALSQDFA